MVTRNPSSAFPRVRRRRGGISVQVLVILVPVVFGLMGFAVDLGRIYMIRGELQVAAEAMALAAAQRLIGTESSTDTATAAAQLALAATDGLANRYDFGGISIGSDDSSLLTSQVPDPDYFDTVTAALDQTSETGTGNAGGATARHASVTITADAPLIFWGFLQQGFERRTPVRVRALAGISAPLCTACGIEPIAIGAQDLEDGLHYGLIPGTRYTLGFQCNGSPVPSGLPGTVRRIPYLILNRMDEEAQVFTEENTQLYRMGAQGLLPTPTPAKSCFSVNTAEQIWTSAVPLACNQNRVPSQVQAFTCGLASRVDFEMPAVCENIPEVASLSPAYRADTDNTAGLEDYSAYTGNTRRVITIPIVDSLLAGSSMVVLGFRQFLLEPGILPTDTNGRFVAMYIGSVVPLKQGRVDCPSTDGIVAGPLAGPGKVVLHR